MLSFLHPPPQKGRQMEITTPISAILNDKGSHVWSIRPDATVFEAISLMAEKNIGALAVLEGDRLVGTISERDYTRKVVLLGRASQHTPVADIMDRELVMVTPRDSIQEAMRLMTVRRRRHLPVMKGDALVGMLSIGDVVNWTISEQNMAISDLEHFVTGAYPG